MRRALMKRLEKLENNPRWQPPPPPSAEDLLYREKLRELLSGMEQKYAEIVYQDLAPGGEWSAFTSAVMSRLFDHLERGTPLAFPAAVAETYLLNPKAGYDAECEECGYKLPLGPFTTCPVCGRGSVYDHYTISVMKNLRMATPK
jgi:hypothetical protein